MNDKHLQHLLRLANEMAVIIDRYQSVMKPREADKARQARQLIKKWKRHVGNAPSTAQAGTLSTAKGGTEREAPEYAPAGRSKAATEITSK